MYKNVSIDSISFIRKKNEILILNNNNFFYYQTCKGFCSKKIKKDRNFIWINFFIDSENKKRTIFFFKELENKIKEYLLNTQIINPFFTDNGIGVNIQNYGGLQILDCYLAKDIKMNIDECPEKFYINPLLWIHNLKYYGDRWYINIKLVQCIIYPIYQRFCDCLIIDDNSNNMEIKKNIKNLSNMVKLIEHPLYGKYFKMINIGVPRLAVEIKFRNDLGDKKIDILKKGSDELIEIKWIKYKEHKNYFKYFKMLSMGIPKNAIESKMLLDNVDISIINEPDKMIMDIEVINDNFTKQINKHRLKKRDKLIENEKDLKLISQNNNRINFEELMEKRIKILNK